MDSFYQSTQVRKCTLMVLLKVGVQGDSLGLIRVRIVEVKSADTDTLYSCHEHLAFYHRVIVLGVDLSKWTIQN